MPYLDVRLNGRKLAIGGGAQLDVLSLSLIGTRDSLDLSFNLSGMRRLSGGRAEHLSWSSQQLSSDDKLRVTALEEAIPDHPMQRDAPALSSPKELLRGHQHNRGKPYCGQPVAPSRKLSFEVQFFDSTQVSAVGTEETLQLVVTWTRTGNGCKVEVDAITVLEDGTTTGHRWVERTLRPAEWFEVKPHIQ